MRQKRVENITEQNNGFIPKSDTDVASFHKKAEQEIERHKLQNSSTSHIDVTKYDNANKVINSFKYALHKEAEKKRQCDIDYDLPGRSPDDLPGSVEYYLENKDRTFTKEQELFLDSDPNDIKKARIEKEKNRKFSDITEKFSYIVAKTDFLKRSLESARVYIDLLEYSGLVVSNGTIESRDNFMEKSEEALELIDHHSATLKHSLIGELKEDVETWREIYEKCKKKIGDWEEENRSKFDCKEEMKNELLNKMRDNTHNLSNTILHIERKREEYNNIGRNIKDNLYTCVNHVNKVKEALINIKSNKHINNIKEIETAIVSIQNMTEKTTVYMNIGKSIYRNFEEGYRYINAVHDDLNEFNKNISELYNVPSFNEYDLKNIFREFKNKKESFQAFRVQWNESHIFTQEELRSFLNSTSFTDDEFQLLRDKGINTRRTSNIIEEGTPKEEVTNTDG